MFITEVPNGNPLRRSPSEKKLRILGGLSGMEMVVKLKDYNKEKQLWNLDI